MKILSLLLGSLAFVASVDAQYFSEGWKPGKAVPSKQPSTPSTGATEAPKPTRTGRPSLKELSSMLDLSHLLASGPVVSLAARAGINMTEKLAIARSHKFWDERITLIDDDNYGDLIVNETMTVEEEKSRVWFLVMYVCLFLLLLLLSHLH
jgi:hypothetical protein